MADYKEIDESVVQDIARRTLINLKFIEVQYKLYRDGYSTTEVYEVTQLINSFLGLLIFPEQEFWGKLESVGLDQVPYADKFQQDPKYAVSDLKPLIIHIRNSISHFRVEIKNTSDTSRGEKYISSIQMEDWKYERDKSLVMTWKAYISVFDLRDFLVDFAEQIIDGKYLNK